MSFPIIGVTTGLGGKFTVCGDFNIQLQKIFKPNSFFTISGSTSNNGSFSVHPTINTIAGANTIVCSSGFQIANFGGTVVGGNLIGLSAGTYTASVNVDGIVYPISYTIVSGETFNNLISKLQNDIGGVNTLVTIESGNIKIKSKSIGVSSTVLITDTNLFSSITSFVSFDAATITPGKTTIITVSAVNNINPINTTTHGVDGNVIFTNLKSYEVRTTDKSKTFYIPPQTIDTNTSIILPGQGKFDYGEIMDTNLIHMLENFSNSTPPPEFGLQVVNYGGTVVGGNTNGLIAGTYIASIIVDLGIYPISYTTIGGETFTDLINALISDLAGSGATVNIVSGNIEIKSTTSPSVGVESKVIISDGSLFFNTTGFITINKPIYGSLSLKGQLWYDSGTGFLKIWDGTTWGSAAGAYVLKAGDTMSGNLLMDSGNPLLPAEITGLPPIPFDFSTATSKAYVDSVASGLGWVKAIADPDLVGISADTPASPVLGTGYIAYNAGAGLATPTGAWLSDIPGVVEYDYVYYQLDGTWKIVGNIAAAAGVVEVRFGVALEHGTATASLTVIGIDDQDLVEYIGGSSGDPTLVTSWKFPQGHAGNPPHSTFNGLTVDDNADVIEVAGDQTLSFFSGNRITISASANNDGEYTIESVTFIGPNTNVVVFDKTILVDELTAFTVETEIRDGTSTLASATGSNHNGHSYAYNETANSWAEVGGPGSINDGLHLKYTGNTLDVNFSDANVLMPKALVVGSPAGGSKGDGTINAVNIYVNGNSVWHPNNDGSTSGLDADLLDAQHGSYYQNAGNLNAGTIPSGRLTGTYAISISGDADTLDTQHGSYYQNATNLNAGTISSARLTGSYAINISGTAANADTLDGQHSAYYQNATNLNAGTIPSARLTGTYAINISGNADQLDSQHGSYYQNATNLNAGTISSARLTGSYAINISGTAANADTLDGQHSAYYQNATNLNAGTIPSARLTGTYAINISGNADQLDSQHGSYYQNANNLNAGTVNFNRLPTGTGSTQVSIGNHSHGGSGIVTASSGLVTYTGSGQIINWNHGKGKLPLSISIRFHCIATDLGWSVGTVLFLDTNQVADIGGGNSLGTQPYSPSTTSNFIQVKVGSTGMVLFNTIGTTVGAFPNKWRFEIIAIFPIV